MCGAPKKGEGVHAADFFQRRKAAEGSHRVSGQPVHTQQFVTRKSIFTLLARIILLYLRFCRKHTQVAVCAGNIHLDCPALLLYTAFVIFVSIVALPQRGKLYGRGTQQTLTQSREFPPPLTFPPNYSVRKNLQSPLSFHPTLFTLLYILVRFVKKMFFGEFEPTFACLSLLLRGLGSLFVCSRYKIIKINAVFIVCENMKIDFREFVAFSIENPHTKWYNYLSKLFGRIAK